MGGVVVLYAINIKTGELRHMSPDELAHYGVLGMKWGVRRAAYKTERNKRLASKAKMRDAEAAAYKKAAESAVTGVPSKTATKILGRGLSSHIAKKRSEKYSRMQRESAVLKREASKTEDVAERTRLIKEAAKRDYKTAKMLANSKQWTQSAMKFTIKSNKMKAKAEKARLKIAKNNAYVELMKKKMSELSPEKRSKVYEDPWGAR